MVPKNHPETTGFDFIVFRARLAACIGYCYGEAGVYGRSPVFRYSLFNICYLLIDSTQVTPHS